MKGQIGRRWLAAAVVMAAVTNVSGQSAPPVRPDDVLAALLTEVRGLRAAMEQMASAGPRVQLFASRLQLQETRINNMIRRLDTVRDNLAQAQQELASAEDMQKRIEEKLASTLAENSQERAELSHVLPEHKRQVTNLRAQVSRLSVEENQLMSDIATEQARWTDINQRLDELEKVLAKR
jgi:chromosome segregation ATPase